MTRAILKRHCIPVAKTWFRLFSNAVLAMFLLLFLSACATRGTLGFAEFDAGLGNLSVQKIFVATTRKPSSDRLLPYSGERSDRISFGKYAVSIPPNHETGQVEWGAEKPDPQKHFAVQSSQSFDSENELIGSINAALRNSSDANGEISVFIHGFNTNFAEGLYRYAQMLHDYETPDVAVHYSWPSAAQTTRYVYDRDSTAFARDGLEKLLNILKQTNAKRITVAAHSMGSFLTMEAMRQLSISGQGSLNGKLAGLILLSPDIDEDVFVSQASRLDPMPKPFIVFTSPEDKALKLSSFLTGNRERLGSITDAARLDRFGITLVDLGAVSDGDSLNHLAAGTSPIAISLIKSLGNKQRTTPNPIFLPGLLKASKTEAGDIVFLNGR